MIRLIPVFAALLLFVSGPAASESARIFTDGVFTDWDSLSPVYSDPSGDGSSGDIDFGRLWIDNDENRLHMCLEVGSEINIQDDNRITVFMDTDNDASTGEGWYGIGADVAWTFGQRSGFYTAEGRVVEIWHDAVGFVCAPTVTGERFEFTFDRDATPLDSYPLFWGDTLRIVVRDPWGEDVLPDAGDSIVYVFDDASLEPFGPLGMRKREERHIRFLSYNVLFDGIFDTDKRRSFDRILNAVVPDIIGFQEIYDYSAEETRDLVAGMLPRQGEWYGSKVEPDIIAVSRYPIVGTYPIGTNGAFLIDLGDDYEKDVLVIAAHPPCCGNDYGRQLEIDAIMAFIRDAKAGAGQLELAEGTPIVILGDMNFVGDRRQLNTLLTGEIVNTGAYGPQFRPDWDETDLSDARPMHTETPMAFTWQNDDSPYWPGRLDFIIYTDAVLDIGSAFVLSTREMHEDTLSAFGLRELDTVTASDHLPVVCDFAVETSAPLAPPASYASPNPARGGTTAIVFGRRFTGASKEVVYYDVKGRRVRRDAAGPEETLLMWDGKNSEGHAVAPGIYFALIRGASAEETVKVVYLR